MQIPVGAPDAFTARSSSTSCTSRRSRRPSRRTSITSARCRASRRSSPRRPKLANNQLIFPDEAFLENTFIFRGLTRRRRRTERRLPGHRRLALRPCPCPAEGGCRTSAPSGAGLAAALLRDPAVVMLLESLKTGTIDTGFTAHLGVLELHGRALGLQRAVHPLVRVRRHRHAPRLLIGYPLAYVIAFRGGKYRNALLLLVIVPFFVTYLIRTLSWETILSDSGVVVGTCRRSGSSRRTAPAGHHGPGGGGHHLQLPALHDPAALRVARADRPAGCWRRATTSTGAGATCSCG